MQRISSMVVFMTLVLACMLHASSAQTTHVVGNVIGWIVPPGGDIAYRTWAASQRFNVGDILVFNYATGAHDVAEVNREAHDSCNSTSPISMHTDGPTNITLTSAGEHYFICTIGRHCSSGQRLAINVSTAVSPASPPESSPPSATSPGMAPSPVVPVTPSPAAAPGPSPSMGPTTHIVGNSLGWIVPPGGPVFYPTWAMGRRFIVGDTLVFNFTTGQHDVAEVTQEEYNSCNTTTTTNIIMTGPASIRLTSAGEHYYICTIRRHCSFGQLLAINVTGGNSVAMPPGSNGPSMQPNNPTTPTTRSNAPPPQSNTASSFAVAALPFTFLAIAAAFLYI